MKLLCHSFLVIVIGEIHAYENENIYDDSGWRPISNLEIHNKFMIDVPNRRNIQKHTTIWSPIGEDTDDNINVLRNNVIKLVKPQEYSKFNVAEEDISKIENSEITKESSEFPQKVINCEEGFSNCQNQQIDLQSRQENIHAHSIGNFEKVDLKSPDDRNNRKAKKIDNKVFQNAFQKHIADRHGEAKESIIMRHVFEPANSELSSYEVTENIETEEIFKRDQTNAENKGYFYKLPQFKLNQTKPDLTNTLSNILSRYRINTDDKLQNYALSRATKPQYPISPDFVYVPVPIKAFDRNNGNNLKALAVILSNYGYYLSGFYGLRNNYRNMYSYLASNNIHNNKPFGGYKILSDTDSSNK